MAYHSFLDPSGNAHGSFEVFRITRQNRPGWGDNGRDADGSLIRCGYYWQACFPGCLPDGEPMGPFRSEAAAVRDALEMEQ